MRGLSTLNTQQLIRRIVAVVLAAPLVLSFGEFMWWSNAKPSYPQVLVGAAPQGANDILALNKACGEPLEVAAAADDKALVRCGMWWPSRSVWIVPRSYVAKALPGSAE